MSLCKACGQPFEERGYQFPLCEKCRTILANRPLPKIVKAAFLCVLIILILSFTKFPDSLKAGIAFEKGRMAEDMGHFEIAALQYKKVVEYFPNSDLALARLGIAQYKSGKFPEATRIFSLLSGRSISKELTEEINLLFKDQEKSMTELNTKILESKIALDSIESQLEVLKTSILQSESEIKNLSLKIDKIEADKNEGLEVDISNYNQLINRHNSLVELHNKRLKYGDLLYGQYLERVKEVDSLIGIYNSFIIEK